MKQQIDKPNPNLHFLAIANKYQRWYEKTNSTYDDIRAWYNLLLAARNGEL